MTQNATLLAHTVQMLKERPRTLTYRQISAETGLPCTWLIAIACGEAANPSVNRVETLYQYLSGRPLQL